METADTEQHKRGEIHPKFGVRVPRNTQKKARIMKAHRDFKTLGEYVTALIEEDFKQLPEQLAEEE